MTLIDIQMIDAQGFMLTILIPFSARLNSYHQMFMTQLLVKHKYLFLLI